ncbi:MAG TPA: CBS domain-containing protein [Candidatus Altiarchaeales archaeon]|nr:CBS domain-containing protein [Candidatus Altiarchaeales archaeon]
MVSSVQREILDALIRLYERKKTAIKGEDISELLNRSPGTVRNQMQTLRALGYVDGVPGPRGGYTPAIKAYEALDLEPVEKPVVVPIFKNGKKIEGLSAYKIIFVKIPDPTECKAIITVKGESKKIRNGDIIKVGPTPTNHVIIKGEVTGRDDIKREILVDIHSITSIPKGSVEDVATKNLISIEADMSLKECGLVLMGNRINAAPIIENGKLLGIVTLAEIVRAVAKDKLDARAMDIAIKDVLTIEMGASLLECIEKMEKHDVGRLIVTNKGKPAGIITRTNIIRRMSQ